MTSWSPACGSFPRNCAPLSSIVSSCPRGDSSAACGFRRGAIARCATPYATDVSCLRWKKRESCVTDAQFLGKSDESGNRAAASIAPLPPDALIIVPVRNLVLFPGLVLPITIGRGRSIAAAQQAVREERQIGILMQRAADVAEPAPIDMHRMGTVANIMRYVTAPDGTHHLVCQGEQRFQVMEFLNGWPFFVARVLRIPEPEPRSTEIEARFLHLKQQTLEAVELLPQAPPELVAAIQGVTSPAALADLATTYMDAA